MSESGRFWKQGIQSRAYVQATEPAEFCKRWFVRASEGEGWGEGMINDYWRVKNAKWLS
jgi:hypothetical protein